MGCREGVPWLNYEGVLVNMACCVHLLGLICMDLLTCLTTCQDRQVHNNDAIRKRQLQYNLIQFSSLAMACRNDIASSFVSG